MNAQDSLKLARRFIELPAPKRHLFLEALKAQNVDFSLFPIPGDVAVADRDALSYAQQRMWFAWQMDPHGSAYNLPMAVKLSGSLDRAALQRAVDALVGRHETLRTVFGEEGDCPVQQVQPHSRVTLDYQDCTALEAARLDALTSAEALAPFDLTAGPLLRVKLLKQADDTHLLLVTLHHIVADGWSMGVLIDELVRLYDAATAGEETPLAALPIQYRDYGLWQRSWLEAGEQARQLEYWLDKLGDEHPVLQLPADFPRPMVPAHRGERYTVEIDARLAADLRGLAKQHGVTLFMLLLASFSLLLYRYSGQNIQRVGVPIANRHRPETEGLIGCFINTQVLQTVIDPLMSATELLRQVRDSALHAQSFQDLPFEKLVEALGLDRSGADNPLFRVLFNHQSNVTDVQTLKTRSGLLLEKLALPKTTARFDLALDTVDNAGQLQAAFTFAVDLFERSAIERMAGHWLQLLADLVRNTSLAVGELPLDAPVLAAPQGTEPALTVHGLIEQVAAEFPRRIAAVQDGQSITYARLNHQAGLLQQQLQAAGVLPEQAVGVVADRSLHMLVAILAILKSGAAYVPLEPDQPDQRLAFMLDDARITRILAPAAWHQPVPAGVQVLAFDRVADAPQTAASVQVAPGNLAYIIYTSGTTGTPKGVAISHGALVNYVQGVSQRLPLARIQQMAMTSTPAADLGHTVFYGALCNGKTLHLLSKDQVLDADVFAAYMREQRIDALKIVPSHLHALLAAGDTAAVLPRECLVLGGEACSAALLARIAGHAPALEVINHYGPTESTVGALTAPLSVGHAPHLGRALDNLRVQVLDASLWPVPGRAKGELHIGGAGLARGYVGRPALTAERFVPDPAGPAGSRMYRSGDFVQRDAGGELRFIGRMDHQVKIRGYRVEPGEVEQRLQGLAGVRNALVRVGGAEDGPQLLAYVVPHAALADEAAAQALRVELQQSLKQFMPEHMIPGHFLFIDQVPLTANGKVDASRLPVPGAAMAAAGYAAPVTAQEQQMAAIWQAVLGVDRVGLHDNFFALGGHSLLATQVVSRGRRQSGLDIPLRLLFDTHSLRDFCAAIADQAKADDAPLRVLDRGQRLPVSHAQHRQWLFWKIHPQSAAYNTPMAVRVRGVLDREALQAALDALVARHESLRTRFVEEQGVPYLNVLAAAPVTIGHALIGDLHGAALEARLQAETQRPFDLATGPLLRVTLLQVSPAEHLLLLTLHHIVSDGWSMSVMVRECIATYNAHCGGTAPVAFTPLPVQYADYATWQREQLGNGLLHTQLGYWKTRLEDDFSVLELPADRVRPHVQSFRGGRIDVRLPDELTEALRRLAVGANATLFHIFLASFGLLLARYSASEKINIGVPVTNRNRLELEGLIGFFVNTLVMRVDVDFSQTFSQMLAQVKETSLQAQANKDIPFDVLVEALAPERGLGHNPLFQVMYNHMRDLGEKVTGDSLTGATVEEVDLVEGTAQFDLSLDTVERTDGVLATFVYASDLFDHARIEQMAAHWLNLLQALVAQPAVSVDRLALFSPGEHARMQQWSEGPSTAHMANTAVARLFEARALAQPDAPALLMGDAHMSYAELNRRANRLAHKLRELGVGPEVLVGVAVERSLDMVVGLLAILKTGGAYVPLDPDYPRERLAYMMQDSAIALLLTQTALQQRLALAPGLPCLCLDQPGDWLAAYREDDLNTVIDPQSLAYVMYTSGSTGRPKGVGITQGSLSLHAQVSLDFFNLSACDRILQFATFNFDGFVEQLYPALICGASVVIRGPQLWDSETFYRELIDKDISVVDLTTAYWFMLAKDFAAQGPRDYGRLHQLHAGGEAMPPEGVVAWKQAGLGHVRLLNTYGPTEATVTVTAHDCSAFAAIGSGAPPALMPIGKALGGRSIYLLDNGATFTAKGAIGELQVGGALLARGYHNRPALTAERFIPDPFCAQGGGRLYRTGDLARYVDDGVIEYVGRIDHQVKIRGFRIELGEISARLLEHPQLNDALVIDIDGVLGKQLVGYLVPADASIHLADVQVQAALLARIRDDLRNDLPDYMVPAHLVWMHALPLTPNGKLDRKALPAPDTQLAQANYVAPGTELEQQLCDIWASVLRIERVGVHDNFFELGGHSLLAAQAISRINTQLGIDTPIRQLFETPVLGEFSRTLASGGLSLTEAGLSDIEQLMNEMTEA